MVSAFVQSSHQAESKKLASFPGEKLATDHYSPRCSTVNSERVVVRCVRILLCRDRVMNIAVVPVNGEFVGRTGGKKEPRHLFIGL
jgi:hypothetical protein